MEDTNKTNTESTSVEQVEINLDEILGTPGAENVMLPEDGKKPEEKPNIFSKTTTDLSFLDNEDDETDEGDPQKKKEEKVSIDDLIDEALPADDSVDNKPKGGRPKTDKSGMLDLVSKLIEKGQLVPFDDDKPLEEYGVKDFEELLEANFTERENKIRQDTPREFFEALPEELQYAAKYVADGGQDLKGLFKALSQVEEMRQLDVTDNSDQEQIVREYLRATNFGNTEEIEEEIDSWKDMGSLESKARKFKPKLDKMQESIVAQRVAQQEQMRKKQQQAAEAYMNNVYQTLTPGELNGVKLDKRTQALLYNGLVQPQYPSMSGKQTNLLGHLLEKYQYVEPRHDLIAEALWLLSDPDGYKSKIKEQGKTAAVEKTVRQLKTEQAKMTTSTPVVEEDKTSQRRIPRNNDGFWKR
jgi:hypothetical protein